MFDGFMFGGFMSTASGRRSGWKRAQRLCAHVPESGITSRHGTARYAPGLTQTLLIRNELILK
jgi:hypothetical protein